MTEFDHFSPAFIENRFNIYSNLRDGEPLAYSSHHGGYWVLSRYADIRGALLDWKTFTSAHPRGIAIPSTAVETKDPNMLGQDPPQHTQYRSAVSAYFSRPAIDKLEPSVLGVANEILDDFIADGHCEIIEAYATPLMANTLALFLRMPLDHVPIWEGWAQAVFRNRQKDPAAAARAYQELDAYMDAEFAARKKDPRDDFFTLLTTIEIEGRKLTDSELRGYGSLVLLAGREASIDGLSNALWYLANNPEARARLIAEPALIRSAVEEFLRYMSPIQLLGRVATRDVVIHDQQIKKGDKVATPYGCANRDERTFENADQCVLDRRPNPHLAFGAGPHGCIGAHLARLNLRAGISEWLRRIPDYQLDQTKPPRQAQNGDTLGFRSLHVKFG
jgi:hypothetical protein